ncbi:hypothetical protein E8E14_011321 [Neopestalotiopsis sp. 37M]|nr:hypothetical protein E8E14_011321 [Neopestalotiopsis sp. 37M]
MDAASSSPNSRSYAFSSSSYYSQLPAYARSPTAAPPSNPDYDPNSAVSDLTENSTPLEELRPLDRGPPGFNATITLFEGTANEKIVYLGPWEVFGSEGGRRVLWQCSYQLEHLEHFLPTSTAAGSFAHTEHYSNRQFTDPITLEQHITFCEPHRIRYTDEDGVVFHDQPIQVRYEFTTLYSAVTFQSDLRKKDLLDVFDVDVVWTDTQGRRNILGRVRGIGTLQRLKLWRDPSNFKHSLTVFANHHNASHGGAGDGICCEFQVNQFEREVSNRDDQHRTLQLNIRGNSQSENNDSSGRAGSVKRHYRRFQDTWGVAQISDSEYHHDIAQPDVFELPFREMTASAPYDLSSQSISRDTLPLYPPSAEMHEVKENDGSVDVSVLPSPRTFASNSYELPSRSLRAQHRQPKIRPLLVRKKLIQRLPRRRLQPMLLSRDEFQRPRKLLFQKRSLLRNKWSTLKKPLAQAELFFIPPPAEVTEEEEGSYNAPREPPTDQLPIARMFETGRRWFNSIYWLLTEPEPQTGQSRLTNVAMNSTMTIRKFVQVL